MKKPRPPRQKHLNTLKEMELEFDKWARPNYPDYARSFPNYFKELHKTNNLEKCIVRFIELMGWQAERVKTSGTFRQETHVSASGYTFKTGCYTPGAGTKGSADISATIEGIKVAIEVKNSWTKDTMKDHQQDYLDFIEASGGRSFVARDFDSTVDWLLSNFIINPNKHKLWELKRKNKI